MPTILIVEDDFGVRELLAELLDEAGYKVVSTAHGREALSYLQAKLDAGRPLPALILTVLHMPQMDGRALIGELHRNPRLASVPIIAMSAAGDPDLAALPVAGTFEKPIVRPEKLLAMISSRVEFSPTSSSPWMPALTSTGHAKLTDAVDTVRDRPVPELPAEFKKRG